MSRQLLSGFCVETDGPLTIARIVCLMTHMQRALGITVAPEPIREGGIVLVHADGWYKSMRLGLRNWPEIHGYSFSDSDLVLHGPIRTFFKAFYPAPDWTSDEIQKIIQCFKLTWSDAVINQ